mmetsp:Transcript_47715/g.113562  ORF Transcript_47715/g.113562 Transcript_47715/m.113562 type:complete len:362 (+) Transcript_47715:191-1276(+)
MIVVVGTGSGEVAFANLQSNQVEHTVRCMTDDATVELSPCGGKLAIAGKDRMLRILDATTGEVFHSWRAHEKEVCALCWGDNNLIASCSVDGKVSVWDPAGDVPTRKATFNTSQQWRADEGPYRVRRGTFIRGWAGWLDEDTVIAGDYMGQAMRWNITDSMWSSFRMTPEAGTVHLAALCPSWETMLVCARENGKYKLLLWDVKTSTVKATIEDDWNEEWNPYAIAFSPRGRSIAISSDDKRVKIWKLTEEGIPHGKAVRMQRFEIFATCVIAFTPDGGLLVGACQDDNLRTWDAETGLLTATVPLTSVTGDVCSLAFSPEWLRERSLAFAMAVHDRLGVESPARILCVEPLMLVLHYVGL